MPTPRLLAALVASAALGAGADQTPAQKSPAQHAPAHSQHGAQNSPVLQGPWLLDPTPHGVTVAWVTASPSIGKVVYGELGARHTAHEEKPTTDHRVHLRGLQPARKHHYLVEGTQLSGTFWTAPATADAAQSHLQFRVVVYGDNRTNPADHQKVVDAAAKEGAHLALHTGDLIEDAKNPELWQEWFAIEKSFVAHTPIAVTVGNHDVMDGGTQYWEHFRPKNRPAFRSFDYGPLHVVMVDTFEIVKGNEPQEGTISAAQREWLVEDLKHVPRGRHVWMVMHHGPFSFPVSKYPQGKGHGGSEAVKVALAPHRKQIEAVFAGHDHYYQRGLDEGLHWFVVGGGGAPSYAPDPHAKGVKAAAQSLSYLVLDVCGCHVHGTVKDPAGKVLDRFSFSKCETACGGKK
jgi:Icc-related predicted phosphoesterase